MTISIPSVPFPAAGTGRDMTGRLVTCDLVMIMSGPAAPPPGQGRQPAPPGWPGDRSGVWLRNAAAGLCVLAAAAAAVSFTAQERMVDAARHLPAVAALEAAIPDAAALVFACLGVALALHGRRAIRARALNLASVGASVFMNAIAAAPGWRNLAIWAMPPVAYALASDTLIGVVRAWSLARHQQLTAALADQEATPLAVLGGLILWLLRLALAPASTLAGFRAWVLEECPVAPGRRATLPPAPAAPDRGRGTVPRKATKTARFLCLVAERYGPLASIPLSRVAGISAALAPAADLNPGAAVLKVSTPGGWVLTVLGVAFAPGGSFFSANTYVQNRNKKLRFLRLLYDLWDFAVVVLPSAAPADAYDRVSAIRVGWETAGG